MPLLPPGQRWHLAHGDCLSVLRTLPDASIDAIVTDPPYELAFMGKKWDATGIAYSVPLWRECLRVLRPGGHMVAFGGTRTHHRVWCAIEDAGFHIRDTLSWLYGSGFPKSLDVSKAIDREKGAVRPRTVIPEKRSTLHGDRPWMYDPDHRFESPEAATPEAATWAGWGTALKPATEPICLARKPHPGTVAANVLRHGTGALNVDACRIDLSDDDPLQSGVKGRGNSLDTADGEGEWGFKSVDRDPGIGRFPPNLLHDASPEVMALFPVEAGGGSPTAPSQFTNQPNYKNAVYGRGMGGGLITSENQYADTGSAARFFPAFPPTDDDPAAAAEDLDFLQRQFYCPKASVSDREAGLVEAGAGGMSGRNDGSLAGPVVMRRNHHPTVKPLALMEWLCRLITPPGGLILDPFTGSGSSGKAALLQGFHFYGIELNPDYLPIITGRLDHALAARLAEESRPVQLHLDLFAA